jgi:hypothetical protein
VPFFVRGASTSRAPLHAEARPRSPLARGERPVALPAVHRSDGPSGHPLIFLVVADAYLAPGCFSPGFRRASPVSIQPFAACCRHYPAGTGRGCQPAFFRVRCCLRQFPRGSASGSASRGLHDVRYLRPTASLPGLRRVCQEAPRRAFATPTRLLSFMASWPLPCRDFHSLGCTAFLRSRRARARARGRREREERCALPRSVEGGMFCGHGTPYPWCRWCVPSE